MKERISLYQATLLSIFAVSSTSILFLPMIMIERSGRDAWISAILLIVINLALVPLYYFLSRRMGKDNLIDFTRKTLGNLITIPLTLNLVAYFIMISGIVFRQTAEILTTFYPLTPLWFFLISMIIVGSFYVYNGLETMARNAELYFYLLIILFGVIMALMIDELSPEYLQPVLARGFSPVLKGTLPGLVFFSEIFIILIWSPSIKNRKNLHKAMIVAIIFYGSGFLLVIFYSIMFFGSFLADEFQLPLVTLVGYIRKLDIIERIDPYLIFFWTSIGIGKATLFMYGAVYTTRKLLNTSNTYLPILFILPFIFYFSFYYFQNIGELTDFIATSTLYFVVVQILFPLLIYLASLIRGVKEDE